MNRFMHPDLLKKKISSCLLDVKIVEDYINDRDQSYMNASGALDRLIIDIDTLGSIALHASTKEKNGRNT